MDNSRDNNRLQSKGGLLRKRIINPKVKGGDSRRQRNDYFVAVHALNNRSVINVAEA